MRIVSWNVNGLYNTLKDASVRYASASRYFSEVLNADIICFQEAKIQEEKLEKWMACVPGYESFWAFSVGKKGYSGVVTYCKEEILPLDARSDYLGDMNDDSMKELCREGRLMETDHGTFTLINVYVPNAGDRSEGRPRLGFKMTFLKALEQRCNELICAGKHVLILGDFNIAHQDIDVYKKWNILDIYSPEEIEWMDAFFAQYVDLFRHIHPDARDVFSVWDQKSEARIHNEGLRIDYAVCDKEFLPEALDVEIVKMSPKSWSDHAAIVLTLKDQPVLPVHAMPTISSGNMKRFQEDYRQKKLTSLFKSNSLHCQEEEGTGAVTMPCLEDDAQNKSPEENKVLEVSPTRMSKELHSGIGQERTVDDMQNLNDIREEMDCSLSDDLSHATGDSEYQNVGQEQNQMASGSQMYVSAKILGPQTKNLKRILNRKQTAGGKREPKLQVGAVQKQQKNVQIRSLDTHVSQNKQRSLKSYFHKQSV